MRFRGDDRGVSVQIGAILLFAILIVWIALWQASVVPQENARIEFTHSQRVQDDMQDVRSAVVSAPGGGAGPAVAIDMAPTYPQRTLFVNPRQPQATIRTVGTGTAAVNVSVDNATAPEPETGDYWDGSRETFDSGGLAYDPGYNEFDRAPTTVYENSVLFNRQDGNAAVVAGQSLVDGRRITLVALNGSLDRTRSESYSLDLRAVSTSTTTVSITNDSASENVTVSFVSRLDAGTWEELLRESGELSPAGHVTDVSHQSVTIDGRQAFVVTLEFERGVTYELRMAKVGVGSGATPEGAAYAVDAEGNESSVPENGTQRLVVEVRDRFNNPVPGVTVEGAASTGSLVDGSRETGNDGRAVFTYEAPADVDGGPEDATVNFTFDPSVSLGGSFDPTEQENVGMEVTVRNADGSGLGGGGGGAYSLNWQDPSAETGTESPCDAEDCTWNLSTDTDDTLDLTVETSPSLDGVHVDFAVNDSSLATVGGDGSTTGGTKTATLTAQDNGTVAVYAVANGDSDRINVTLTNVSTGPDTDPPSVTGASITNAPISDSDTGSQTVTVTYDEAMNTSVDPTVEIAGLASSPYSVTGSWSDSTTWTGTVSLSDDDEEVTATIEVSGAEDAAGNVQSPNPDSSNTFQVDTQNPQDPASTSISPDPINDATETSVSVDVSFPSTPESGTVTVRLTGPGGSTVTESVAADTSSTTTTVSGIDVSGLADGTIDAEAKIVDAVGNQNPSGYTATSSATKDTTSPSVTDATITAAPINQSDTGTSQTVTVTYDETMDTSEDPTVQVDGLASSPYSVSPSGWVNATTWRGAVTLNDDDEEATATVEVSGAEDAAGNTQSPNPDTSNTFQVDTLAPTVSNFNLTNPSGTTLEVSFDSTETLSDIAVDITNSSGTVATLTEADFTSSGGTYTATYTPPAAGEYTATLRTAEDAAGNDGSSGESDTAFAGTSADQVQYVSGSASTGPGTGRLDFDLANTGDGSVTVERVSVSVPTSGNNIQSIFEQGVGSGATQREMYFDAASDDGHYEAGENLQTDPYGLGTTVSLTDVVTMDGNSNTAVSFTYFGKVAGNNYQRHSVSGETVEVTLHFADGSSTTISFVP